MSKEEVNQDQHPNFRNKEGKLYLVKCFACGSENYAPAVSSGYCVWCGWGHTKDVEDYKGDR